jgi:hypothetical protein
VRVHLAIGRIDPRAATILACHIALERELWIVLERLLPRPDRLKNVGFVQKVQIMNAAWQGDWEDADRAAKALIAFNELRNAVSHGNDDRLDECLDALRTAYHHLHPNCGDEPSIEDMTGGIIAYIVKVPTPEEIRTYMREQVAPAIEKILAAFRSLSALFPPVRAPESAGCHEAPIGGREGDGT